MRVTQGLGTSVERTELS